MRLLTTAWAAVMAAGIASGAAAAPDQRFWSHLDQDGSLSAGWVQVLPVLSTACNLRLDSGRLNATLVDLSRATGNRDYTRDLYGTLDRLERRRAENGFVARWNARFRGDQAAACATAETLWGSAGTQFSGILLREASADATATIAGARSDACR